MLGVMSALSLFRRCPAPTWHTLSAQRKKRNMKKRNKKMENNNATNAMKNWTKNLNVESRMRRSRRGPSAWPGQEEYMRYFLAALVCCMYVCLFQSMCMCICICVCVVCVCLCVGKLCYLIQASFQAALQLWNQQSTQTTQMAKIFSTNWRSKFMAILVERRNRERGTEKTKE